MGLLGRRTHKQCLSSLCLCFKHPGSIPHSHTFGSSRKDNSYLSRTNNQRKGQLHLNPTGSHRINMMEAAHAEERQQLSDPGGGCGGVGI